MNSRSRLVRLVYASVKTPVCTLAEMPHLLKKARAHNGSREISGLLCFSRDRFLQCLEGEPGEVNALYSRIMRDPRHGQVTLLDYRETSQRNFARWSMGYLFELDREDALLRHYFSNGEFDPHRLNGTAALAFLKGIAEATPLESVPQRDREDFAL